MKQIIIAIILIGSLGMQCPGERNTFIGNKRKPSLVPEEQKEEIPSKKINEKTNPKEDEHKEKSSISKETELKDESADEKKVELAPVIAPGKIGAVLQQKTGWSKDFLYGHIIILYYATKSCDEKGAESCKLSFQNFAKTANPKMENYGNSGYITVAEPTSSSMDIYHYGRIIETKHHFHSEDDLLQIIQKIKCPNCHYFMTSFYSSCKKCQEKIKKYLEQEMNVHFSVYYHRMWNTNIPPDFNEDRFELKSISRIN